MRKWIFMVMLLLGTLFVSAQQPPTTDTETISRLLRLAQKQPPTTNFPLFFARQFSGRPYVAYTLEVNDNEQLVLNTRELDCTTLVENVAALTICVYRNQFTVNDFKHALIELRYRQGKLDGYCSRLHYFTDWIVDNQKLGLVEEVQSPNPPFTEVQKINTDYMSKHPQAYKALKNHPSLVETIRKQEKQLTGLKFRFIPKCSVGNTAIMKQAVHDGDIIAITCSKPGLDIAHLGFAVWRKDGLHLLNASQLHKRVLEEPMTLYNYLQKHPSHTGIRIIRIKH